MKIIKIVFGGYTVNNPPINKIGGNTMNFLSITSSDDMWEKVSQICAKAAHGEPENLYPKICLTTLLQIGNV